MDDPSSSNANDFLSATDDSVRGKILSRKFHRHFSSMQDAVNHLLSTPYTTYYYGKEEIEQISSK